MRQMCNLSFFAMKKKKKKKSVLILLHLLNRKATFTMSFFVAGANLLWTLAMLISTAFLGMMQDTSAIIKIGIQLEIRINET